MNNLSDDEVGTFFAEALEAEGLHNAEVKHCTEPTRSREVFRVHKRVNGNKIGAEVSIPFRELENAPDKKQHLASRAALVVRNFNEEITEVIEWGENAVELDLVEDHTATCRRCGAEVSIDDVKPKAMPVAETAVPRPVTRDYSSLPEEKLRMTLLALLKEECHIDCPFSPHDW